MHAHPHDIEAEVYELPANEGRRRTGRSRARRASHPMKSEPNQSPSPEKRNAFVAWLVDETVSAFVRAAGDREALKAAVFLFLNRAYEAGLAADEITDLLGIGPKSAMSRASLSKTDEEAVFAAFDELDELIESVHAQPPSTRNA
jgi:hypothetical protein